jgi:malonyl CoA-acyl carrier protein transacylase
MNFRDHLYSLDEGVRWDNFKHRVKSAGYAIGSLGHSIPGVIAAKAYQKGYGGEKFKNFALRRGAKASDMILKGYDHMNQYKPLNDKQIENYRNIKLMNHQAHEMLNA